jgi:hypothetical protein
MRGDGMEGNHGKRRQMDGAEKDRIGQVVTKQN